MKLHSAVPPFIRSDAAVNRMLGTAVFALAALLVLPTARYGPRPLVLAGCAVLTCFLCELICGLARTGSLAVFEPSFAVTGLVVAMLMPVNAPLWFPCAAAAFAELAAKLPFGSFGRTPFNPAAAGTAFAALCWPRLMFAYADPAGVGWLPAFADCTVPAAESPAAVLKSGLKPDVVPLDLLWGGAVGPMGTTAALVIGACALLLFVRRAARWETTVCFLAAAAALAAFFPRIACSPLTSVKYELLSGSLLFCSVFMVNDPVTLPRTAPARCLYGAFAGAAVMAFRYFGAYEQGASFAVLLANAVSPLLEAAVCRARGWGAGAG